MSARRPLASVDEVSAYLAVPVQTLYTWRKRDTGPKGFRVGRHIRYYWADVDAWVEQQAEAAS